MTLARGPLYNRSMAALRPQILAFALVAFAVVGLTAADASAQFHAGDRRPDLITSTSTSTVGALVGSVMLTVQIFQQSKATTMRRYLRDNEPAVRAALVIGGDAVVRDLADLLGVGVDDHRAFARLLRRERRAITRFAYERDEVDVLLVHLRTAIAFDPALRPS